MDYSVMWQGRVNTLMNTVQLTGIPYNFTKKGSAWRLLLQGAVELVDIAEEYQGRLISSEPPKRNGEFVYFEVIFKNKTDCEGFLEAMRDKSS